MAEKSRTPLRDKLGIKSGMRLYFHDAPAEFLAELDDLEDVTTTVRDPELANFFHYFVTTRSHLQLVAEKIQHLKAPDQILWISWPKQSSKVQTDISEQDLRNALLPIGMVDVKSISISAIYSAVKFVWRKK